MDDKKQPGTPGIGSETFQLKLEKDWFQPDYVIGVDTAYYDCERSVVSVMKKEENTEGQVVAYFIPVRQPTLDEYGQLVGQMAEY